METNYRRYAQLKQALNEHKIEVIQSLLDEGCPVNSHLQGRDLRTPLHYSVYLGCPKIVKQLIDRGASVNATNLNNETPLMLAAKFEKNKLTDLLLEASGLKNCHNNENLSHLHIACMRNQVDVVKKLLCTKADINEAVKEDSIFWPGYTPLHFAVKFQCLETVEFLLKIGADITIKDARELTPLHWADMVRNEPIIDIILEAHKTVSSNPANSEGLTHFHIACTRNNPEVVECFMNNGASVHPHAVRPLDSYNWKDMGPLDLAIHYECIEVVKLLLMHRHYVSAKVIDHLKNAYRTGNMLLVNLILTKDRLKNAESKDTASDLHIFSAYNLFENLLELSREEVHASLNSLNWQGSTPLHLAIENDHFEAVTFLLRKGSNCEIKNARGKTALHLAFDLNRSGFIDQIMEKSLNYNDNPHDNDGISHLHIACIRNDEHVVKNFIHHGADVNSPVSNDSSFWPGFTPLHLAVKFASNDLVYLLLQNNASCTAVDEFGLTAFDLAIKESCDFSRSDDVFRSMSVILCDAHDEAIDSFNNQGFTLLHLCYFDDNYCDIDSLIEESSISDINKAIPILNTPWDGYTPLHFMMEFGTEDYSNALIEKGANILCKAADGNTPLHLSLTGPHTGHSQPLNLSGLVGCGENLFGTEGFSLFHVACVEGHIESIKYFLDIGVDPNLPTKTKGHGVDDKTPLHLIVERNGFLVDEVTKLLVEKGAYINAKDAYTNVPLHCLSDHVDPKMIGLMVSYGANVNAKNFLNETPLIVLFKKNQPRYRGTKEHNLICELLRNGADINLADDSGQTILSIIKEHLRNHLYREFVDVILEHVTRMKILGHHVSDTNDEAYTEILESLANITDRRFTFDKVSYTNQCTKEVGLMSDTCTDNHMTLRDIMFKSPNELAVISGNDEFQRIVNADDFLEKFPNYGPMLKFQLKMGQTRKTLLKLSRRSLCSLTGVSLPSECSDMIFKFLDNQDLTSVIAARDKLQVRLS